MLIAKCSHSSLLCLCGNREYPGSFQNKLVSSYFKWVLKSILEGLSGVEKHRIISDLSLTCGGNVNYYKSVHHPIRTRGNREHRGNFQNKSVSSSLSWVSRYILFLAKLKGRGRSFLKAARRRCHIVRLPPRALGCHKR